MIAPSKPSLLALPMAKSLPLSAQKSDADLALSLCGLLVIQNFVNAMSALDNLRPNVWQKTP